MPFCAHRYAGWCDLLNWQAVVTTAEIGVWAALLMLFAFAWNKIGIIIRTLCQALIAVRGEGVQAAHWSINLHSRY
jgi:hypothetical protein